MDAPTKIFVFDNRRFKNTDIQSILGSAFDVHILRGSAMQTEMELYKEFAQSFHFPDYFGWNSNAFDECMTDLDEWLPRRKAYAVVITKPWLVMAREENNALAWFIGGINHITSEWAKPVHLGEPWDRDSVEFRFILEYGQRGRSRTQQLWTAAGAELVEIN
jgi:hypothetical protein